MKIKDIIKELLELEGAQRVGVDHDLESFIVFWDHINEEEQTMYASEFLQGTRTKELLDNLQEKMNE